MDFINRLRGVSVPHTLKLGRDLPHGFFGLYGLDARATKIMKEGGVFLHERFNDTHTHSQTQTERESEEK